MFNVVSEIDYQVNSNLETSHSNNRWERLKKYEKYMNDDYLYSFIVDTNHDNGLEVHSINSNGLIYIRNMNTDKLITILHARHQQLSRYFNSNVPQNIRKLQGVVKLRNEKERLNEV